MFGAWTFNAAWQLIVSSFSITNLIGIAAVAVAVAMPTLPKWLPLSNLRQWAIVVAAVAFGYSAVLTKGFDHGLSVKQDEWDASLVKETDNGEKARADAIGTVGPMPTDRRMLRSDPFNRNSGTEPICK